MFSLLYTLFLVFSPLNNAFYLISRRNFVIGQAMTHGYLNNANLILDKPNNDENGENNAILHTIKNHIYFTGPITEQTIFALTTNLVAFQYRDFPEINLHIQSPGGALLPTLGLVDLIRNSYIPINTYIEGYVASAGTLISVVGNNRYIGKHGTMLIHQVKMGSDSNKYNEIKDYSENADTLMSIIKSIYLENSKFSEQELDKWLSHDLWMNATTCKKFGLVDILI